MSIINGSCLCGAIHYQVEAPVSWCAHCHCNMCRKAHGSAFVTWFGVAKKNFKLLAGSTLIRWYRSSPRARRGFCNFCGSTVFFEALSAPDEMQITVASAKDGHFLNPQGHVFWDEHVQWVALHDTLPRLNSAPQPTESELGLV